MTDWQAVLTDYRNGMKVAAVHAKHKIGRERLYRFLRRVSEPKRAESKRLRRDPQIIAMLARGVQMEQVARRFRMSPEAVRQVLIRRSVSP